MPSGRHPEISGLGQKVAASAEALFGLIGRYRDMFKKGRGMGKTLKALIEEINYRDYISGLYKTPEAAFRRMENMDGFVDSITHYESSGGIAFPSRVSRNNGPHGPDEREGGKGRPGRHPHILPLVEGPGIPRGIYRGRGGGHTAAQEIGGQG